MLPMLRRDITFILVSIIMIPLISFANEGLEAPQIHPLCRQEAERKEIKKQRVWHAWPDGSVKMKSVYFADGTWVQVEFYQSGQRKRETHSTRYPRREKPEITINGKHGTEKRWHENGKLQGCGVYQLGKAVGTKIVYAKDGTHAAAWVYQNGKEIEHLTYSKVFGWQPFRK